MASNLTIGFLGAGKMATALAKGFIQAKLVTARQVIASDLVESARDAFAREVGAKTAVLDPIEGLTPAEQSRGIDYLALMRQNLAELRSALGCR